MEPQPHKPMEPRQPHNLKPVHSQRPRTGRKKPHPQSTARRTWRSTSRQLRTERKTSLRLQADGRISRSLPSTLLE